MAKAPVRCLARSLTAALCMALAGAAAAAETERVVDIGAEGDEAYVGEGFYGREGPYSHARIPMAKRCDFRWASNRFRLRLPVFPRRHNQVCLRAHFSGRMVLRVGERWSAMLIGLAGARQEYTFVVPREVVGERERLELAGSAARPRRPAGREKRTLFAIIARVRIRALDQLPPPSLKERLMARSKDVPTLDRVRGIERRPPAGDPVAFAERLAMEGADVVTLGAMNGHGHVFFPSEHGVPHPRMDPRWLPEVIAELRRRHVDVLCWVCFNVQDVRDVGDFVPARRFPQWAMEYIATPGREWPPRTGICVVSSPYIEHHAKKLCEAAEFDIDGFFFDGFYLGGVPHPVRPGCVCQHCRRKFKEDTGLDLPERVDWTDMGFKRWVRWRNERLLAVARRFQREMRKVRPRITCTFNYNIWPFGHKDWETAIPVWRVSDFGVSQHGYSGDFAQKWLMPGFKARIGRDINPRHTDMWRACAYRHTCGRGEPDMAWHELEITTFLLAGLSHGIAPWHSTIEGPIELSARIHAEVARRERYFSRRHVANVAVLYSQNTHDFYGHIPGTENLAAYRDGLLGTWMVFSEGHVPFEFVFDNQLQEAVPPGFALLVLPNAAALSAEAAHNVLEWARRGGHVVASAETGAYDEWGERRPRPLLPARSQALGEGSILWLADDPGLAYCRRRDAEAAQALLGAARRVELPFQVDAPKTLVVNLFRSPDGRERWVHLLNVSPFFPGGDTGFRGVGRPSAPVEHTGDPETGRRIGGPLVPATDVVFRLAEAKPRSARLVVADQELAVGEDGQVTVPRVDLHDVLVLEVE
ncbi:MAG: alpha-amylase family protein [Candidatus Brocadiia bacterium]